MAVFLRIAAFAALLPAFGERSVPVRVKLAVALTFTMIVAPVVPVASVEPGSSGFARLALTETAAGAALGLTLRFLVIALQTAGAIAAQSTSLSHAFGGDSAEPAPAMAHLFVTAGLCLAVMSGLHVRAASYLIQSYDMLPSGTLPDGRMLSVRGVQQVSRTFALAFTLAAPFVIASVLYNLALGAINRAMPQLMVSFVGAPVITLGGLVLLLFAGPLTLSVWNDALSAAVGPTTEALR